MKLFKAMVTVAGMTGLSRIAGFIRDVMTANILGAGPVADAFFVALKLPNFFRRVTAEGAFSVSFVPRYAEVLEKDGESAAALFASRTFTLMLLILSVFTVFMLLIMPVLIYLIAPGFQDDPERYDLAVTLTRITFPYLLLMSLTALLGGVLNAHDRFAPFSFAPTLFNLSLIGALLLSNNFENVGYALSYGVFSAGLIQLAFLYLMTRKAHIKVGFAKPVLSENIKEVFRRMGPGIIGAGVMQINLFADLIIASFLQTGAISYLYYADRLNQLPLGVIGIAVGTALLPMLTKAMAGGRTEEARHLFNRSLEVCLLLGLPAGAALFIVPHVLIQILFEHGAFTAQDTYYAGYVLMGYAVGLPAYIGVKVLSSVFWAQGDTKTPVKIAIISAITNITGSLILIQFIGIMGLTLATSIAGWVQYVLLNRLLPQDMSYDSRLRAVFPKILGCVILMTVILYCYARFVAGLPDFLNLICLMGLGLGSYGMSIFAFKVVKLADLKQYFRRKKV